MCYAKRVQHKRVEHMFELPENPTDADLLVKALELANEGSKSAYTYNKDTAATLRASRMGLPLIHQFLEDAVFPYVSSKDMLPDDEGADKQEEAHVKTSGTFKKPTKGKSKSNVYPPRSSVEVNMSYGMGYLYEALVTAELMQTKDSVYYSNYPMSYKGINGHCDHLLINANAKLVTVVETKCIQAYSAANARDSKLWVDNWGYLSQLSFYTAAAYQMFPGYTIKSYWRVFAKGVAKDFIVEYPGGVEEAVAITEDGVQKLNDYIRVSNAFVSGNIDECVDLLLKLTEDIPPYNIGKTGYYNSCGFHYNELAKLLCNSEGTLLNPDVLKPVVKQMLTIASAKKYNKSVDTSEVKR
jgi:hypothetical protein